jgi:lipid-A-disaccharide synthase
VTPRILVSAGEPSGDLHGAPVITALRARFPGATIDAFGGPLMRSAGASVIWPMERYTVMGFAEVLGKVPAHYRLLRILRERFRRRQYDLVILIDYPGFHLRVAEAAQAARIPVLYYIAPQLWAWRPQRAGRFTAAVDRFAVIFTFEEPVLRGLGLDAHYVGHPLMDRPGVQSRAAAREQLGIPANARVLALFPGSRSQELSRHWTTFRDAGRRLLDTGKADRVIVATVPTGRYPDPGPLTLVSDASEAILAAADAAIVKSGTTTLEAALADVAMVVGYRVHPVTAWFARRVMRVKWIGLVNLIADAPVVDELLQGDLTVDRLVAASGHLLDPHDPRTIEQRAGLALVRERLGGPGAAQRVAGMAEELLQ